MPNVDPIQVLISQGYPPETAKKMVESGAYDAIQTANTPLTIPNIQSTPTTQVGTTLPGLTNINGPTNSDIPKKEFSRDPEIQALIDEGYTREEAQQLRAGDQIPSGDNTGISPEIQGFLDQGYNMEEAQQLSQSTFYNQGNQSQTSQGGNTLTFEKALNFGPAITGTNDLEASAFGLGQAIGSEKGKGRTLSIIGNAGKLAFSGARNIASGIGQAKRSQYIQEYANKQKIEGSGQNTYTAAPQTQNTNYLGGNSYGEEGGIKGKTLPLKSYLTNKGFKKPGYKKL